MRGNRTWVHARRWPAPETLRVNGRGAAPARGAIMRCGRRSDCGRKSGEAIVDSSFDTRCAHEGRLRGALAFVDAVQAALQITADPRAGRSVSAGPFRPMP